ncbi:zein-binding domain-containing protein [Tanacetum coccineum]
MVVETSTTLKDTLCVQQQLLQKLYNELEVEREALCYSHHEALAMILRLQGEKAAVKMEAEHYKRLSEEKMYHAEESMELFEDLIQQKEMEIANLDYQLSDTSSVAETSPETLLRRNSAPPKLLKLAYLKRGNLERNRSVSPDSDMVSKKVEESERKDESNQNLDSWKQMDGSISSYWDQIRS